MVRILRARANEGDGMRGRHPWVWLGKRTWGTGRRGLRPATRLAVERLEDRATPAAVFWDGGGDNLNWSNAQNWSNDVVPTSADDVTINRAATPQVQIGQSVT